MDLESLLDQAAEAIGLGETKPEPKRKKSRKAKAKKKTKVAAKAAAPVKKRGVGRPPKIEAPAAKPIRLPKTKLLKMRFVGDSAELTFRDLRKLKTPLKYLDKRLLKLEPKALRGFKISANGKTVSWAGTQILIQVADALQFTA